MKYKSDSFIPFKKSSTTLLLAAIASVPISTQAQGDTKLEEEIVVTGFRGSLRQGLDVKRNSINAVDSILAEDIADFPDTNLAEALQRLPGISISREAGEGREITVRGLGGDFTRVQINGAMAHSLAAGSGGARTTRSFDFNVFASELFNRVDVVKTTSAEMEEGSLGSTVNLYTGKPFDYDSSAFAVNVQGGYNEQSEKTLPRLSGLASFSNSDKTFGGLLSVAYAERFISNVGAESGRWEDDNFGSCSACADQAETDQVYAAWHPRFPRFADKTHDQDRLGITGALQFQAMDSTLITMDLLYANINSVRAEPFMEAISLARTGSTGVQESDIAAYTLDQNEAYIVDGQSLPNDTLIAATIDGVDTRSEYFISEWESEFSQYQIKVDQDFSDRLRGTFMYTTSTSTLDNRETTTIFEHFSDGDPRQYATYAEAADAVTYDYSSMLNPQFSYNFDTTNPANFELSEFRDRVHDGESGVDSLRLDGEYDVNDNILLKIGVNQQEYTFDQTAGRSDRAFDSADAQDGAVDGSACGVGFAVDSSMGSVQEAGSVEFFIANQGTFDTLRNSGCWPFALRPADFRDITEETTGAYVQLDFNFDMAGHDLRGNVGVRNTETDLTTSAVTFVEGVETPVTVNNNYSDTLPALNLAYNFTEELVGRASWAKVMSRPSLGTLSPFGSVTIFGVPAVSYGNPLIDPYRADNFDLSLEWYLDDDSLLSIAYFGKDIESFPTTDTSILPWSATGLPDSLLGAQADDLRDADFEVSRTVNGGGATLDGWEFQYQQAFTFMPDGWLKNTGVIFNYTKVDSEEDETGLPLTNQSPTAFNLTIYYEDDLFSTRLAYSYRDKYNTSNDDEPSRIQYRDETGNVDFSASYQFTEQFKASLEVLNLTDEPILDYMSPGVGRIVGEQTTGRQWLLGVSYKY